jgi:glycosyltransferase involved in cell wall biosynthesis
MGVTSTVERGTIVRGTESDRATVDVVVPCYRYGHMLPTAVGSVLGQSGVDVRVLVIDDASDDDSASVARRLAEADSRVEVVVHAANRGHIATFNEGVMDWAKADYTVLMSADDALTPGALQRAADLLDAHPSVGLVYGRPIRWPGGPTLPAARTGPPVWTVYPGHRWLRWMFERGRNCVYSPEVVVRTAVQREVGGYTAALPHTSDLEMWMRFAVRADIGHLGGVDQAYYREHGANMSGVYNGSGGVGDLQGRWDAFAAVLAAEHRRIIAPGDLENRVRRRLAREALARASRAYDEHRRVEHRAEELVEFAALLVPRLHTLPEWYSLGTRKALGLPPQVSVVPRYLTAAGRRARFLHRDRVWRRTGI